jgi:uncharacterized membrane protein
MFKIIILLAFVFGFGYGVTKVFSAKSKAIKGMREDLKKLNSSREYLSEEDKIQITEHYENKLKES